MLNPAKLPPPPWPDLPHLHHEGTRSGDGSDELDLGSVLLGKGIDTGIRLRYSSSLSSLPPWRRIATVGWQGKEFSGSG